MQSWMHSPHETRLLIGFFLIPLFAYLSFLILYFEYVNIYISTLLFQLTYLIYVLWIDFILRIDLLPLHHYHLLKHVASLGLLDFNDRVPQALIYILIKSCLLHLEYPCHSHPVRLFFGYFFGSPAVFHPQKVSEPISTAAT